MLFAARDTIAFLFLEQRLRHLREEYLALALDGKLPDDDFYSRGEQNITTKMKQRYYSRDARIMINPDKADELTDEEDFEQRTQKLGEQAVIMTHERLKSIGFVGQPGRDDF